uniref:Inner mitochondrial membrane peptidase subunit 1 n=1 Tax=Gallus gallus TaxID=9031 RepID=A0A8V0Z9P2_CHICK
HTVQGGDPAGEQQLPVAEGGPSAGHGGQAAAARAPEAGAGGGGPSAPRRPAARRHHLGSPAPDRRRERPGTAGPPRPPAAGSALPNGSPPCWRVAGDSAGAGPAAGRRGDIVIVKSPTDPKSNICKRVIGLEGDKVCTSNPSDFLKTHSFVPKGHVWLEGDNLRNSTDSRCYGPVPYGLIRGRICFKIWPLNDFGFLRASPNGHRFLDD